MRNPLFPMLPSSYCPCDKLVTYYLYCYDKDAREQERTAPQKKPACAPKKKRSELER